MEYLLLIYIDETLEHSPEEAAAIDEATQAWDKRMIDRGILKQAQRLSLSSAATTVSVRNDEVLLSDGPFAEAKEQLAGFVVLDVANLDEALEAVAEDPLAKIGSIEVRPYWSE